MISPEKILKKITLKIIGPFFKKSSNYSNKKDWRNFKRVLVFRLDNKLGNAILLLPLIQSIKHSIPEIEIDVMYSSSYTQIFENHPDIHSTIIYDQKYLLKNPYRYLGLIKQLRKNKYDVVFSSTNSNSFSVSQALFAGLLKSEYTVGFDWKESSELYSETVKGNTNIHYADAQVDLWRYFYKNAPGKNPKIYFVPQSISKSDGKKVLFWFGATGNKILPRDLFEDIFSFLKANNITYQLAAGPHDEHLIKHYPSLKNESIKFLKGSLKDTAKYFKQFPVILIPDTGPTHLAVALGVPTVQIFVNSNPVWYAYRGKNLFLIDKKFIQEDFLHFVKNHLD
jgi:ADP-heptose:LPS heptosyltransferase